MAGLIIVVNQASKASDLALRDYYEWYLEHLHLGRINNWDLVDITSAHIVGRYLIDKNRAPLYRLAKSSYLWERRAALIATFAFIQRGESDDALTLVELLLSDTHDLIRKASGWVLREVGKVCGQTILTNWLDEHASRMPRVMLRYAIERLPEPLRQHYLHTK